MRRTLLLFYAASHGAGCSLLLSHLFLLRTFTSVSLKSIQPLQPHLPQSDCIFVLTAHNLKVFNLSLHLWFTISSTALILSLKMGSSLPFDPFSQSFTLHLSDSTPFNVSIPDLDEFIFYNVQICINYAAQLGASFVLLLVLLLLTKPEKRKSPIFLLNCISLTLNVIRNVLQCLYFTGPFSETYAYFGQDYSRVPATTYATSVAATVLTFLLLVCVQISLILQVHVVCVTLQESYRHAIFISSNLIALLAIGFRFALCVENSRYIVTLIALSKLNWLESAANITTSISICWFCAVFVGKLAFALYERKKLGLGAWGPMHIIFVMGCQTLVIPGTHRIHS